MPRVDAGIKSEFDKLLLVVVPKMSDWFALVLVVVMVAAKAQHVAAGLVLQTLLLMPQMPLPALMLPPLQMLLPPWVLLLLLSLELLDEVKAGAVMVRQQLEGACAGLTHDSDEPACIAD